MAKDKKPVFRGRTPAGVARYPYLAKPDTEGKFADDKYKVDICIPKGTDLSDLEKIVQEAAKAEWGKVPKSLVTPFKDGDALNAKRKKKEKDPFPEYEDCIVISAKSVFEPGVVDAKRQEIPKNTVWTGDLIKIGVQTYAYEGDEDLGVTFQLRSVQLLEKRNFGSRGSAADDFEDEDDYEAYHGGSSDDDGEGSSDPADF